VLDKVYLHQNSQAFINFFAAYNVVVNVFYLLYNQIIIYCSPLNMAFSNWPPSQINWPTLASTINSREAAPASQSQIVYPINSATNGGKEAHDDREQVCAARETNAWKPRSVCNKTCFLLSRWRNGQSLKSSAARSTTLPRHDLRMKINKALAEKFHL